MPLHDALGREPAPLTFVVSLRLGEPPTLTPIHSRLANYPTLRFKLDATSSWTPELIAGLVATGAVDSVDFKALYHGTIVDQPPDPVLYRARRRGVPGRLDRGSRRRHRGDRRGAARRPRPDHLGRADPLDRRHRGAAVRAADGQHQAVADRRPAASCATPTTTAPSTGSAPTAAASSSSARAAGRPSTWRRCFTPTRPTTSRRSASTSTTRPPGLPSSPLAPAAERDRLSLDARGICSTSRGPHSRDGQRASHRATGRRSARRTRVPSRPIMCRRNPSRTNAAALQDGVGRPLSTSSNAPSRPMCIASRTPSRRDNPSSPLVAETTPASPGGHGASSAASALVMSRGRSARSTRPGLLGFGASRALQPPCPPSRSAAVAAIQVRPPVGAFRGAST